MSASVFEAIALIGALTVLGSCAVALGYAWFLLGGWTPDRPLAAALAERTPPEPRKTTLAGVSAPEHDAPRRDNATDVNFSSLGRGVRMLGPDAFRGLRGIRSSLPGLGAVTCAPPMNRR